MGCDIHSIAQVRRSGTWETAPAVFPGRHSYRLDPPCAEPWGWRRYGYFGWLADVRNYSAVTPLSEPRGWPSDFTGCVWSCSSYPEDKIGCECSDDPSLHSRSYFTLAELLAVDYDAIIEDRRFTRGSDGGATRGPGDGEGEKMPLREFLGSEFMESLEILKTLGEPDDVRVVFAFDN